MARAGTRRGATPRARGAALLAAALMVVATAAAAETAPAEAVPTEAVSPDADPAEAGPAAVPAVGAPGSDPVAAAAASQPVPGAAQVASAAARELIRATLADDIAGAGYDELRAEARRLGLDGGGSRRDLQTRLRRFLELPEVAQPPSQAARVVEVRQAGHAEYRTSEATAESYLVLRGNVELAVRDTEEDTEHVIRADEVNYQQDAELLSARGGVEYVVTQAGGEPQSVRAASLTFDLATSKAVFVDGVTRHQRDGVAGPVTFTFAGDTITRLADATIILDGARFTSSPDPSLPNYQIRAQRMWLLAPGEWGLQGATLSVGGVPVLYLPFFFLPGDEMVFRPALGVRDREGLYLNTTLYLIGSRPPEEEPLSVLSLTDPGQYREELHGLFLRKVPADVPQTDDRYLKLMLDLYARLGVFAGVAGMLPVAESGKLEFQVGAARSRSIWPFGGGVTATEPASGRSHWHDSSLFGVTVPLRYGAELAGNLALPEASLRGRLELFSDPDFVTDFGNREERFDWPALIGFNAAAEEEPTRRSNLTWEINARADFSRLVAGDRSGARLIDQLRLRNAGVRWFWHSRTSAVAAGAAPGVIYDPTRAFFYPSALRVPVFAQMGGTLLRLPAAGGAADGQPAAPELRGGGLRPRSGDAPASAAAPAVTEPAAAGARRPELRDPRALPPSAAAPPARRRDAVRLRYDLRPGVTLEGAHDSADWSTAREVDHALRTVTVQVVHTTLLEHDADLYGGVLGLDNSLRHSITLQSLVHSADSLPDQERERLTRETRSRSGTTVSLGNRLTVRPLLGQPAWERSAVTYDLDLRLLNVAYVDAGDELRTRWGGWDVDGITRHRLQALAAVQVADYPQRLTLSADLPPRPLFLGASLALNAGDISASADVGFRCRDDELTKLQDESKLPLQECGDWAPQPLNLSVRATPLEPLSLRQQFSIDLAYRQSPADPPAVRVARSVSSLRLGGLSAALIALPMQRTGREDQTLGLQQLRLDYAETLGPSYLWRNRIKLELTTRAGWTVNFPDPRSNRFTFSTALTASVHEFLDLRFATASSNDRTFLYVPAWATAAGQEPVDPLQDLWWSFAFWDDSKRRQSNFKIDRMSLSAVHHLQDWDLTFAYTARPKAQQDGTVGFASEFSIVVQWLPVPEIRSHVGGDDESFSISE